MSTEMITTQGRSAAVIATEIKVIVRQTQILVLQNAMEIGKRLIEAKALVPFGEWLDYVERECDFSQSRANQMMQLYKEYGNDQQSLFGGNSQAFADLPYTKALKLLAVPAEEREEFAEKVDAASISTRELDKAIQERNEAIRKENAARELQMVAQERFEAERNQVEKLTGSLKQKEIEAKKAADDLAKVKKELEGARKAEQAAKAETQAARAEKQQIPESLMEQMRKEAETAAAEKAAKEAEAKLRAAEDKARRAEEAAAKAAEKLEDAKKKQAASDPETAVFSAYFQQVQENFNKAVGVILKARQTDEEKAAKYINAVDALLARMKSAIHGEV